VSPLTKREQRIVELRDAGYTYREIGASLHVSHEWVRQVYRQAGGERSSVRDRRYARAVEGREREIVTLFLRLRDDAAVAAQLGLETRYVRQCVNDLVPEPGVLRRRPRQGSPRHSDEELVSHLIVAASECDSPMTKEAFDAWAARRAGEKRAVPGSQAVMLRFGGWRAALTRAGLPANPSAGPEATYDLDDGLNAIASCWRDSGRFPSVQRYDSWRRTHAGFPASATIRHSTRSWNDLVLAAYPLVYGLSPGLTPSEQTAEQSDAVASVLGTPYVHANEATSVAAGQPFDFDPQLLEKALASHAGLQNEVADLAERSGVTALSPNVDEDEPPFDIAWFREDGVLVVVEVKSATPSNLEGQMRLGLGQVLRYAQMLGDRGFRVAPALVAELEPDGCWRRLCERVGVAVAWPGALERAFLTDGADRADAQEQEAS